MMLHNGFWIKNAPRKKKLPNLPKHFRNFYILENSKVDHVATRFDLSEIDQLPKWLSRIVYTSFFSDLVLLKN